MADDLVVSNCKCVQQVVLEEDLPEDVRALDEWGGVTVDLQVSERQFEVWREHAEAGEDMEALLKRLDETTSRNQAHKDLAVGKSGYYRWLKEFGIY